MSTYGYTQYVESGHVSDLPRFIKDCAREFGVTVGSGTTFGESLKLPEIDPKFELEHNNAKAELHEAKSMADETAGVCADTAYQVACLQARSAARERTIIRNRCATMLQLALQWEPPTATHRLLKNFAVKQLRDRIAVIDEQGADALTPVRMNFDEYRADRIRKAETQLQQAAAAWAKERERVERERLWITELVDSLDAFTVTFPDDSHTPV